MAEKIYPWQLFVKEHHYNMSSWNISKVQNSKFQLHWHDEYEIFLFIEGDANYIVEEKVYSLKPYDMILVRKHEMHRVYLNSTTRYNRCVLMVSPTFFQHHNCPEYEAQFLNTTLGINNKIPGEIVRSSGLYDAFWRYKRYAESPDVSPDSPLLSSIIIEILYLINKNTLFSKSKPANKSISQIIVYLNNNYTEDITLDSLTEQFYLSKSYLCRAFRKATGLTVHEYICHKRLAMVHDLRNNGMNLTEAASIAGFHDYSSFYRSYVKEYGVSPRKES